MEIKELLNKSREVWGDKKCTLADVVVRMGVVYGDICRIERDADGRVEDFSVEELREEMGNIIVSTIRWCDDLGFDPEECVKDAIVCQERFVEKLKEKDNFL